MRVSTFKHSLLAMLILLCTILTSSEARAFANPFPPPPDFPPVGTILINNGAVATISSTVTLNLSASDESGSATLMRFSNNNSIWSPWYAYATTKVWTLAGGGGIYTVYAQFQDATGNSSAVVSDTIIVDSIAPYSSTIMINNGAAVTNSTSVTLALSAADNVAVSEMRFSYDDVYWSVWYAYAPTKAWTLTAGDGTRRIYVKFRDAVGNVSYSTSDSIILDQTKPTGTISINNGAASTNLTAVTLNLYASDTSGTISQMRFSNDNLNWSAWSAYTPTKAWTLLAGEGTKTVYAQFQDGAGNLSTVVSDTIPLDLTPPTGLISVNGGAATTNNTNVTLTLKASDNNVTISKMRFSSDNATWSPWENYASSKGWTLAAVEGVRTVYVQFMDTAGNISTSVSDTIALDLTPPAGTISISSGASSTNLSSVALTLTATDNSLTISRMRFSNDNATWSAWEGYATTKAWTLSAGDGIKTVYVQFADAAGNASTSFSDTITLDQTLPTGTILINSGDATVSSTYVTLTLTASDANGTISKMRFSNDIVNWSALENYASTKAWTLSAGEGGKTVYVQFFDAAGNASIAASDTIALDLTPPAGTISINSGAETTRFTVATLTLTATDNNLTISKMRFKNDNSTWSTWENYATTKAWTLTSGEGLKTVDVQLMDAAGNVSLIVTDTIALDLTPPTGTIFITTGALVTKLTDVTLYLNTYDNSGAVTGMRFSNDNVNWSTWFAFAASKAWTLTPGDGIKTVYAQFSDAAGNVSAVVSGTIRLDQTPPTGTISIKNGAQSTKITDVTLTLTATDNNVAISKMRFKDDTAVWSEWENYAPTKAWTLTSGEGVKTVYVQFTDAAGNASTTASDTITLDQTLPTGTISINSGAASTNFTAATFTLSAADNNGTISQMRFKDDTAVWSAWENYATTKAWTLSAGAGTRTVYVQFTDAAGNASITVSDTITLDQTLPTGTISIKNGAMSTKIAAVTLTITATDNSGTVSRMRFKDDTAAWSEWENYAPAKAWTLSAGEGVKTVYVQFMDATGNASTAVSDTIALDLTLPTGTISIKNGALSTKVTAVTLNLTATDNNVTVSQMRFKDDAAVWSAWENYAPTKAWTLVAGEGTKTVYVQFTDAAGNASTAVSDTIALDLTPPTGTISINGGAAATNSANVTITLSATDNNVNVSQMRFKDDTAVWSAWEDYATTKAWTLVAGVGGKTVYVQFTDAAGNTSIAVSDTIRLDTIAPTGVITINNGAASTNSTAVTLSLSASDNAGMVAAMRFSNDNVSWTAWYQYADMMPWTLTAGEGNKTVYAQFKDAAGNISVNSSDTIGYVPAAYIAGRVTRSNGIGIANVKVSIDTVPSPMTATTNANGYYIFNNVPAGSYQLTPSISNVNGSLFSPVSRNITFGTNSLTGEDFKVKITYTVSGTVNYAGTRTGRVYLSTNNDLGTSIPSTGAFTIRGVEPGPVTIKAYMDHIWDGREHATNPSGSALVNVDTSNVSGVVVSLFDPQLSVPAPPQNISVSPSDGGAFIIWSPSYNSNGKETADRYNIYYGTSPSVSPANGTLIGTVNPLQDNFFYHHKGIANGSVLYYVMTSEAGANRSVPSSVIGPVTIGPRAGGSTVSGTVTSSGLTPTGSLIVGLYNMAARTFYHTSAISPAASQPYSVTGVPDGTYFFVVIFDMNNNKFFDSGDFTNLNSNEMVTVTSSQVKNVTIAATDVKGRVITEHYKDGANERYGLLFDLERGRKFPVKIAVVSGPNMLGPLDLGKNSSGGYFKYIDHLMYQPLVGDTYTFDVTYLDGTTASITRTVSGVVNSFPASLSPSGSVSGATVPTFLWSAPSPAMPDAAGYRINLIDGNFNDVWWTEQIIPTTDLSAQFNFDRSANVPALTSNRTYRWNIMVEDQFGNRGSSVYQFFTP